MTIDAITRLMTATPFHPFRLCLASGKTVAVKSPEFVARHPQGRTIVVFEGPEDFEIIDLLPVESADPMSRRNRKAS